MNVLILTPDRVGSTLLQRLITVYMTMAEFDQPVINLHELTNGIMKYYSPTFNREVLGRSGNKELWGYYQSLGDIVELLDSVDHYKTSRLAHYHIKNRQDPRPDQIQFYNYLNDNFYIIAARRDNLLEHGLSWCISTESKRLNVYSHHEKVDIFKDIYKNRITVDPEVFIKYLNQYVEYLSWVDNHFTVTSIFQYERDLPRIEDYILNLSVFNNVKKKTWQETFNIGFKDWNKSHYLISDLSGVGQQLERNQKLLGYTPTSLELQSIEQKHIPSNLTVADQDFLRNNSRQYITAYQAIKELVENKVMPTPVPIKLQTMLEKKLLVKNFDEIVKVYNEWVTKTGVGIVYTEEKVDSNIVDELKQWHNLPKLT